MDKDKDETIAELMAALALALENCEQLLAEREVAHRQKLARALREWKPPKNQGGRPIKHTDEIEDDFFTRLELLAKAWNFTGNRWLPALCKRAIEKYGSNSLRRDGQRQKAEIDQLRNRRNKWRNRMKSDAPTSQ